MNSHNQYSDEFLNAYIDGELSNKEKADILEELRHNRELSERVCKIQKAHNMVQLAYENIRIPEHYSNHKHANLKNRFGLGIAASILLLVGLTTGWLAHIQVTPSNPLLEIAESVQSGNSALQKTSRVMLHVTTDDPFKLATMLDETEALLSLSSAQAKNLRVEIMTNGKGLNLLRVDTSKFSDRIRALQERYDNLTFMACKKAIARVEERMGIQVKLLPGAGTVPSALNEVIRRTQQGWTYIKI